MFFFVYWHDTWHTDHVCQVSWESEKTVRVVPIWKNMEKNMENYWGV